MLSDKDQIKGDADISETQLERVSRDTAPIALKARVNDELQQREHTTCEIQQDLPDTPALCGLSLVIEPNLGNVLDKGTNELDIS